MKVLHWSLGCKGADIAPVHPFVKPPIVPAVCSLCSRFLVCWDFQGWSWRLVLIVLPGDGMCVCWDQGCWYSCARCMPAWAMCQPDASLWMGSVAQSVGWGLKTPLVWPSFFKYFWQFIEKRMEGNFVTFAQTLYNCNNHAHAPLGQASTCGRVRAHSKCSQTVEVACSCSELEPCQREIATDEIQERKNYREHSNIKARVSVHWRA